MAGIRARRKAQTRQAIVEAAIELFSSQGFDGTSIEEIASRAGIGKATVYTYFATKDEIFLTYCEEEMEISFATLQQQLTEEAPLLERLLTFFMIKFRMLARNREFGRQLLREMGFPKQVNEKAQALNQRYFNILEEIFRVARQRGEIASEQEVYNLAVHFYILYFGVLAGWYNGYAGSSEEVENWLRVLFTQTFEGIKG